MTKVRTIRKAIAEIKENDPNTAISEHGLRILINNNVIPSIREGNRFLVDLDSIYEYYKVQS